MRHLCVLVLLASGCGSGTDRATNVLCDYCTDDSQCGGNPCFQDRTGNTFCGRPCDGGCPMGYSCAGIAGTKGVVMQTCFPDNYSCQNSPVPGQPDLATGGGNDGGGTTFDASISCPPPAGGSVSLSGGSVDRLYFGYTGDTRDASSTTHYSSTLQATINNIFTQMGGKGVEFALDGGDHMEASNFTEATGNMQDYLSAAALLGKPVFMTLGNHECSQSFGSDCGNGELFNDSKGMAFMNALGSSVGATQPYYRFDVQTQSGKAVFLVVADDAWDSTQQQWLTQQLTDADANAKFTFVSKHHPNGNTDQPYFQQIYDLVTSHKYTMFLTGHSHEYKHPYNNPRALVMGLGGAPFDNPSQQWWGYATVMQCTNDYMQVNIYDQATGNQQDTFFVAPQ